MNYYNENNPYCVEWLRELIDQGLIPPGEVDPRSIQDVEPSDLKGFVQCHFFVGIAGWSVALHLAGWPEDVPVWTGSCPCQPFSVAGKQKKHADERHLWPAFYRLINECRPTAIFGEQVSGKSGLEWLADVRLDLEQSGYAVGGADLAAAGAGALHTRQRLFWLAYASSNRRRLGIPKAKQQVRHPTRGVPQGWSGTRPFVDRERIIRLHKPGISPVVDGVPRKMEQLRAFGNAIVPAVAALFIEAAMEAGDL